MKTQPVQTSIYEETIINIIRSLPSDSVSQLIDFAKFLESQSAVGKPDEEEVETGENIRGGEEKWDKLFAQPEARLMMREMATEAIEDYRTGKTTDMAVTKDGRLEPA